MLQCTVLYCFLPHSTVLQVAFETEQFAVAKRACGELWNHFTQSDSPQQSPETHSSTQTNLSPTGWDILQLGPQYKRESSDL